MKYVSKLQHVYTQPFIGNYYFAEKPRILIVGHNHYCANPEEEFVPEITLDVLSRYLKARHDGSPIESDVHLFLSFEKAMIRGGDNVSPDESLSFWNSVAFYNYVQYPNTTEDKIKVMMSQQYKDSYDGFFEILRFLKPDYVVAWGKTWYEKMPPLSFTNLDFEGQNACIYHLEGGHEVKVLSIQHPAVAFSPSVWGPIIERFLAL